MRSGTSLIIVPDHAWPEGGNAITAKRIASGLERHGIAAAAVPVSNLDERIRLGGVALLHALHARRAGIPVAAAADRHGLPFLVTVSGTDLYQDLTPPTGRPDIRSVLSGSCAVTVFHERAARIARQAVPSIGRKLFAIPPAVEPLPGGADRQGFDLPEDAFIFFLPAGLRPVKRPLFAVEPLGRLVAAGYPILFLIAGPALDPSQAAAAREVVATHPWVRWLGPVSHDRMGSLLQSADVVLNTSTAEGLSNAVLEAMAARRPVLASKNDGNLAALGEGGMFFENPDDLYQAAHRLLREPLLRQRLAAEGRERTRRLFSPVVEAQAYSEIYRQILAAPGGSSCGAGE